MALTKYEKLSILILCLNLIMASFLIGFTYYKKEGILSNIITTIISYERHNKVVQTIGDFESLLSEHEHLIIVRNHYDTTIPKAISLEKEMSFLLNSLEGTLYSTDDVKALSKTQSLYTKYLGTSRGLLHSNNLTNTTSNGVFLSDTVITSMVDALYPNLYDIRKTLAGLRLAAKSRQVSMDTVFDHTSKSLLSVVHALAWVSAISLVLTYLTTEYLKRISLRAKSLLTKSNTDFLTGIPNRAGLIALTTNFLSNRANIGTLLMLDLNKFKPINDTYGHDAGDAVLKIVATRIANRLRADDIYSRVGGDEFVLFLPNMNDEGCLILTQYLKDEISTPIDYNGNMLSVGVAIGSAKFPVDGVTIEQLSDVADKAMYCDKASRSSERR